MGWSLRLNLLKDRLPGIEYVTAVDNWQAVSTVEHTSTPDGKTQNSTIL